MPSQLSSDDLFLFNQGRHHRLYRHLGAHIRPDHSTYFAVWAPSATAVSVIGDWNKWCSGDNPLTRVGTSGIWQGIARGVGMGERYKYAITSDSGLVLEKADPFASYAEQSPMTASVIWRDSHVWGDSDWMAQRPQRQQRDQPMSVYEVHLGSWQRQHGAFLNYRELGQRLAIHVRNMGFTHVELMPVMEHPFYGSWGYQVTGYFAPTSRYGTPDDFCALVDALHQRNIGVILDFVPAHFPTDAHGLGQFDGTHLYEHADPRRGFHQDWTSYIFNYGRHEVRSFLISSALHWLDRFHLDGLRVDGVASMLYRDYSRGPGEWISDHDGSNHDRDAISFLQELNQAVYASYPDVNMIAEESTAWPGVSQPPENGGLGFGYKWDMGWMHDTLQYIELPSMYRQHHHEKLTFRNTYAHAENFVLPLSHDEVVHGKGSLLSKMPGDQWQKLASLRTLFGYQWTTPGKKLLFMGGELGTWKEWNHDEELDWAITKDPRHEGLVAWLHDLNTAYRSHRALHVNDVQRGGMQWLIADDKQASVIAYLRVGYPGDPPVLVAINFTPVPRYDYRIGVPLPGRWMEILNSDAEVYGGSNVGNLGSVYSDEVACRGYAASVRVTLPPLGVILLVATGIDDAQDDLDGVPNVNQGAADTFVGNRDNHAQG
jgi:1,4-alpha-glucan branching enzyme